VRYGAIVTADALWPMEYRGSCTSDVRGQQRKRAQMQTASRRWAGSLLLGNSRWLVRGVDHEPRRPF
jgi:hypothetical protein